MKLWIRATIASVLLIVGCSGTDDAGERPEDETVCSDLDGDGYGVGAGCAGPDCNDSDPAIHDEAQCADNCEERSNFAPGCPSILFRRR